MTDWEPTRFGGLRRVPTRDSSTVEQLADHQPTGRFDSSRPGLKKRLGLEWRRPLGLPDCPYVYRWRAGPIRVHHWVASDDPRAVHDHPWWFLTFVFRGGYDDVADANSYETLTAPAVRFRPAAHRHYVRPHPGGAWTLVITGRYRHAWGFWPGGRFVKHNKWFFSRGHHPCDDERTDDARTG